MYLKWDERTIEDFSDEHINSLYNEGYLFTRIGRGVTQQTRSVRVDLSKFELSSENRRILKKTQDLTYTLSPIPYTLYTWEIGKMGKDFYAEKFGDGTFSANKIKEILTDEHKSNFNALLVYSLSLRGGGAPTTKQSTVINLSPQIASSLARAPRNDSILGYAICMETNEIFHYSYPFYQLLAPASPPKWRGSELKDTGLGMMLRAIVYAKKSGKKYIYLGSAQRPSDTYKLQFSGVEWWDGKGWNGDGMELKTLLTQNANVKRQN